MKRELIQGERLFVIHDFLSAEECARKFAVRPERGKALVFDHTILHEGVAAEVGIKYVLRTDRCHLTFARSSARLRRR